MQGNGNNGNGGDDPLAGNFGGELTAEQMHELHRAALEAQLPELCAFVRVMVGPNDPRISDDTIVLACKRALGEQQQIATRILADVIDPEKRDFAPRWGYSLHIANNGGVGGIIAPKDPMMITTREELGMAVSAIALAFSPHARALVYSLGHDIQWHQHKGGGKSRLIIPQ